MEQEIVHMDNNGEEYVVDEHGNKQIPYKTTKVDPTYPSDDGAWTIYDTSLGHCTFCGKLGCRENCIQGGS